MELYWTRSMPIIKFKLKQERNPKTVSPTDKQQMPYPFKCSHSVQMSDQSSFSQQCPLCITFRKGFTIWICQNHYTRETTFLGRFLRTINSIIRRNPFYNKEPNTFSINFRQAAIMANNCQETLIQYKKWEQVTQQVSKTISSNLNRFQHYDKWYFGFDSFKTMDKYRSMKKVILQVRHMGNNKSQTNQKFKITKSALFPQTHNQILLDSTLKRNYDFYPVQAFSRHQKSKLQTSLQEISKLKKNLSLMISDIKLTDQAYPSTKNFMKPFIDFVKPKDELRFRRLAEGEISEIHEDKKEKGRKAQQMRLYTSPDPQQDRETERRYAEAYGFLLQQNPQLRNKKKKSLLRKQLSRDKSSNNLSKTKLTNYTKSSRQGTQQGSQLMISATINPTNLTLRKSQSKSKLKGSSKNKIILATSTSANRLKIVSPGMAREKSLNRTKKLLGQYK